MFNYVFGPPTPENLAKAIMSLARAIQVDGGHVGNMDTRLASSPTPFGPLLEDDPTHPFQGIPKDDETITVLAGSVIGLTGADPAGDTLVESAETDVVTIGNGSIWIELEGSWEQTYAYNVIDFGDILTYRWEPASIVGFSTSAPSPGADWGSGTVIFRRILDFETVAGKLSVSRQYVRTDLFVADYKVGQGS